jgi:putative acetyltransferase
MQFHVADLDDPRVAELVHTHLTRARAETAVGSSHALDLSGLRSPDVTLWSAWEGDTLAGVGALRELDPGHGEVKSMYTAEAMRGKGVGSAILRHIMSEGRKRGMTRLSLETGSWPYFEPARALYRRHGFVQARSEQRFHDAGADGGLTLPAPGRCRQPFRALV